MKKLSYEEFDHIVMNGESRENPGEAVGYVLVRDDDGKEFFYREWTYADIEVDESGEVTHVGQNEIEKQDKEAVGEAYADYIGIIESAGKTTFGVWTDAKSVEHYTTQAEATDAWHAAANELEEGESVYIARFADGDIDEDFPSYLVREDGEIGEYSNGERMWL